MKRNVKTSVCLPIGAPGIIKRAAELRVPHHGRARKVLAFFRKSID